MKEGLRPIERRVLALRDQGLEVADIARRFRRGEAHVERIISWTQIPRQRRRESGGFRPIERRIMDMRSQGLSYEEIGSKFGRNAEYAKRIEGLAQIRANFAPGSQD